MDRRGTEIAGRNVPVESGEIITIDFCGGPQPGDAGPKDFWVIFNERDAYIARWRHGEDRGERFRIMENEKGYERAWEVARTATGIRPATRQEVIKWLRGHPEDARGSCGRTTTSNSKWSLLRSHHSRECGRWLGQRLPPDFTQELPRKLLPTRAKEAQRRQP
jgi:hypothetical protein